MTCNVCGKGIHLKTDFHGTCGHCGRYGEVVLCGDCLIDADLVCPECGGMMREENEENAGNA